MNETTQVIAHRGDPVNATENTLPGILRSIRDGAAIVEVDVRLSSDGTVVLVHDETTERIYGVARPVAEQTWTELSSLRAPDGSSIPTLAEVLAAVAGTATLLVDMTDEAFAHAAVPLVGAATTPVAWCGDHEALRVVREALPDAEIYLTMASAAPPSAGLVEALRPAWVNPWFGVVTPDYARAVADLGVGLSVWTVDLPVDARRMAGLGARRIISNRAVPVRTSLEA